MTATKSHNNWSRREFLEFMGVSALSLSSLGSLVACSTSGPQKQDGPLSSIRPSTKDDVLLAQGLTYQMLLSWGDSLNKKGQKFGFNNDYIAYIPLDKANPDEGILWVNHEAVDPIFASGYKPGGPRTKAQVETEIKEVGGSLVHIKKENDGWVVVPDSQYNRRLDANSAIPLVSERPIAGKTVAYGTMANCAGGVTPWNHVLTCEENYHHFFGERVNGKIEHGMLGWSKFIERPPEHYGWVVEVNPRTGQAKKLTALGRFAHESATVVEAADGRCVVYSGDDDEDQCVYKFVASEPNSLEKGELFVANIKEGRWISLDINKNEKLKERFKDQTDLLIHTREAAALVGGTPLDRPEDIEVDPRSGAIFVTLTNNKPRGNYHGSILKIEEKDGDYQGHSFKASTYLSGGTDSGFSCPDNMVFDKNGNLWVTSDISGSSIGKGRYKEFGNNGLFYIPLSGEKAGEVFQVGSAPNGAEFTGPCFSPDGQTLFLSVQHPGERTKDIENPLSHWPTKNGLPRPSVITISGPTLQALTS